MVGKCLKPFKPQACCFSFIISNIDFTVAFFIACPCENGGTCLGSSCACVPGFTGFHCQTLTNCPLYIYHVYNTTGQVVNPCINGACPRDGVRVLCSCNAGYTGSTCNDIVDNCASNPCSNGGACTNGINSFTCTCAPGYTGRTCTQVIDNCLSNPCVNGYCTNAVAAFTCACNVGYTGLTCSQVINHCSPTSCLNGGQCVNNLISYQCNCSSGFGGINCSQGNRHHRL
jgi:hypothetical protein